MTIRTRGLRAVRGLLVLFALALPVAVLAQADVRVSGTFGGPTGLGGSLHGSFACTGAPLTITFSGPDTALMTLLNGRTTNLKRHRF